MTRRARGRAGSPAICTLLLAVLAAGDSVGSATMAPAGDLQASNLLEFQAGRDPTLEADDRTKLFNQFILDHARGGLRLGLRFESYRDSEHPPFGTPDFDYAELAQKFAEWSSPGLRVRVGNGYAMLGRGLLLRAFELPGVLRTAVYPPVRYAESRDLDGVIIEARRGRLGATLLSGRPVLDPGAPPGAESAFILRRGGTVSGGRAELNCGRGLRFGASYLRTDGTAADGQEDQGGVDLEVRAHELLPALAAADLDLRLYGEYAGRGWRPFADGLLMRDGEPHALYTALEINHGAWGASFETKRYHRFNLAINDPPSAVPEFSPHLLNRATHVLQAQDERGHQLAVQGALPRGWTAHAARAFAANRDDVLGEYRNRRRYEVSYLGLESPGAGAWRGALFGAFGQDEPEAVVDRHGLGVRVERSWADGWSAALDLERQVNRRTVFAADQRFTEHFLAAGVARAGRGSLTVLLELADDPVLDEDTWWGASANVQLGASHEALLFAGRRRGGNACTSGTCYFVPDFRGAELRLLSRF